MKNQGFIAISSLLIISTVVLAISLSISLTGINQMNSALGFSKSQETLLIAQSCTEEAMIRLRRQSSYSTGSLTLGAGSCTINVSGTGSQKTIDIQATIPGPPQYIKKLQITAKLLGNSINIITWQEIE